MLSGQWDGTTQLENLRTIREAASPATIAQKAAAHSRSTPLDLELSKMATTLARRSARLQAAAQRATTRIHSVQDPTITTNAAHIFPESTNAGISEDAKVRYCVELYIVFLMPRFYLFKREYASSVWDIMERFGQSGFRDELDGPKIHRLTNILTLEHHLHTLFNKLSLWLEADDVRHDATCDSCHDL
jgi:hypothetical protein